MKNPFLLVFGFFKERRRAFWLLILAVGVILGLAASKLELIQDLTRLVPQAGGIAKTQEAFLRSAAFDKLVIHISSKDSTLEDPSLAITEYAEQLAHRLETDSIAKKYITSIKLKLPDDLAETTYQIYRKHLPLFLEEKDYAKIDSSLDEASIAASLAGSLRMLSTPAGAALREHFVADPLFYTSIPLQKLARFQAEESFALHHGYIMSEDLKSLLMVVKPNIKGTDIAANTIFLDRIDQIFQEQKVLNADLETEYFGGSAVAVCNAKQVQKDIYLTMSLALILMALLIWGYFRQLSVAFLMLIPVAFGMVFAAAMVWFTKGSISAISLGSGAVIIGIAIDYSLHFLTHFKHTGSVKATLEDISVPLIIGNVSTIGAFFGLTLIDSAVLQDFGTFSAFSLLGGSLFTLILLPQLVKEQQQDHQLKQGWLAEFFEKVSHWEIEKNKWIVLIGIVATVFFSFFYTKVKFQDDLSALNYVSPHLKQAEEHISKQQSQTNRNIFVLYSGEYLEGSLKAAEKGGDILQELQEKKWVHSYTSTATLLPSDSLQKRKAERWMEFWTPERKEILKRNFAKAATELGLVTTAFEPFFSTLDTKPDLLDITEKKFFQLNFLSDFISNEGMATSIITQVRVAKEHTLEVHDHLATQLPQAVVLDKQHLANRLMSVVKEHFNQILAYSSLLIFFILLVCYGRIELTLITFLPMFVSWVWILGLMALLGIEFNIVNIIISTFIFGLGDDYSIFIMEGLQSEYASGKKNLASYKTAIFLSMLSTLIGVGVLIFAKHPALKSIAFISVVGILCVLFIGYLFIPLLFRVLIGNRAQRGLPPITFFGLTRSLFAFFYYLLGCIILTFSGLLLFKIFRSNHPKVKLAYHTCIMYMARSLMYIMYMVKKRILNPHNERFDKPAVIVANHQSFLDILSILMLHPKLIFFTNNWVWNSPFFGKMVQMAEFYSVENGIENSLELVKRKVEEGYSIVIFPEGGRSKDGTIKRFHKGAFYLAETLQLDIVPIVLHGTGHCMSKGDFLLNKGIITIQILPRIISRKDSHGPTYQENAKACSQLIRNEYQKLNTPAYFYYRLVQNYIYKGPVIEWYMRIKTKLENNYVLFNTHLPVKGLIYDLGCGYGFLSHVLSWTHPERCIVGIDYDEDKIQVAANVQKYGLAYPQFFFKDVTEMELSACDGIVLADVLHYINKENQAKILRKCIEALKPGAVMLLRDGDSSQAKDHGRTVLTEVFSTKMFGFNKTKEELQFVDFSSIKSYLNTIGNVDVQIIEKSANTSNTVLKITKKHS